MTGYGIWSVVAFEVPTTAKWNLLGSNDAAFYSAINNLETYQNNGWIAAAETFTYATNASSVNTNTVYYGTITAPGDLTTKYTNGTKLKFTNSTVKYGVIVKSAYAAGTTTFTVYLGTDYQLTAVAITNVYYAIPMTSPMGFPRQRSKWDVYTQDLTERSKSSPSANTWYNDPTGSNTLIVEIPVGLWNVQFNCYVLAAKAASTDVNCYVTLSTANNSESDTDMTGISYQGGPSGSQTQATEVSREKQYDITAVASYYLNIETTIASMTTIRRGLSIVRARFAYL